MEIKVQGLPIVLLIIFMILKLTNVISWSWWWVISPLWIGVIVYIISNVILSYLDPMHRW